MRPLYVGAIVAASLSPILAAVGIDWLGIDDVARVGEGEDARDVGAEIAAREFTPRVELAVLGAHDERTARDDYGGAHRAAPDEAYRHLTIQVTNVGRLDVAVHTWHFSVRDDVGRLRRAEVGLDTRFEVTGLRTGDSAVGEVVFLVPTDARLVQLVWQGELANATVDLGAMSAAASPTAPTYQAPPEKPDP